MNIVILFSSSSSSSSSGRGKELISHDIYRNNTVKKREREQTPERERERKSPFSVMYALFLMCACINRGRTVSSCAFVFQTPSPREAIFVSFFDPLFFFSLLLLKICFFSFCSHTTPAKEVKKNKKGEHEPSGIVYAQGTPSFLARE